MEFSDDAEETFSRALRLLVVSDILPNILLLLLLNAPCKNFHLLSSWHQSKNLIKEGEYVTLVQSGAQPIWRRESSHHIQVRQVQG